VAARTRRGDGAAEERISEGVIMDIRLRIGQDAEPSDRECVDEGLSPPATLALLSRLLNDLDRQCDLRVPFSQVSNGTIATWEADGHVYFEIRLPRALKASIDVSAHDRTLFICIER
jgi:hypothetical protein